MLKTCLGKYCGTHSNIYLYVYRKREREDRYIERDMSKGKRRGRKLGAERHKKKGREQKETSKGDTISIYHYTVTSKCPGRIKEY